MFPNCMFKYLQFFVYQVGLRLFVSDVVDDRLDSVSDFFGGIAVIVGSHEKNNHLKMMQTFYTSIYIDGGGSVRLIGKGGLMFKVVGEGESIPGYFSRFL